MAVHTDQISSFKPAFDGGRNRFSLLAVIVLYRLDPLQAVSVQTLQRAYAEALQALGNCFDLSILLVDNTPDRGTRPDMPAEVTYLACPENLGLANAYNRAITLAKKRGCEWLLTLDQDTKLPENFLTRIVSTGLKIQADLSIGAIVPQVYSEGIVVSPYYFRAGALVAWFPKDFTGVPEQPVSAFNSAAIFRLDALEQMGGYDPHFWLDNSDSKVFRGLQRFGKRVFVIGEVQVEHDFSMKKMQKRVSPWRYRNLLLAESAFWDEEMNGLAGCERTLRLALRYFKHLKRRDSRELQSITLRFFQLRLLRSRSYRRALFRASVEKHLGEKLPQTALPVRSRKISVCMAAYNGGKYIDLQLRSILPQLGPEDEVIIVDDCSMDNTREQIRALADKRVRLLEHARNLGVVRSFENALRSATGDYLFLSDDDDIWAPDKVESFMREFERGKQVQLVTSSVSLIDSLGKPFYDNRFDRNGRFTPGFFRNVLKNQYQGSAMAFRAALLDKVLPIPCGRGYLHDVWIGTVNDRSGGELVFIEKPMLFYRRHPGNFSRKLSRWAQLKVRIQLLWDHALRALKS